LQAVQGQVGDLVSAAVTGDEAAFTEIVARHHRDLLRVAYVVCRDRELAEDAVQSAWSAAWRRMGDLRDHDRLRGWLVAVAANEARQIMRRRRWSIEVPVSDAGGSASSGDQADEFETGIVRADLRRAVAALDPTDRALLALRYVGEMSSAEIGAALGMTASGARGRLSRLVQRLRGVLADD